jgi:hypothetical protein
VEFVGVNVIGAHSLLEQTEWLDALRGSGKRVENVGEERNEARRPGLGRIAFEGRASEEGWVAFVRAWIARGAEVVGGSGARFVEEAVHEGKASLAAALGKTGELDTETVLVADAVVANDASGLPLDCIQPVKLKHAAASSCARP